MENYLSSHCGGNDHLPIGTIFPFTDNNFRALTEVFLVISKKKLSRRRRNTSFGWVNKMMRPELNEPE
jgi:hypothetical protein